MRTRLTRTSKIARGILAVAGCLLLPSSPALAGARELSRSETGVIFGKNTITAVNNIKYGGYRAGETITVTLDYTATCNIVFRDLASWKVRPFAPPGVTGQVFNVSGTPAESYAAITGSVTFDIRFDTLSQAPTGARSGLAYLTLVLGADKDCNLATGDADGVDGAATIRVQISVSTE